MGPLLNGVKSPADLRRMDSTELVALAEEIRQFLVESVSKTGGHLGPNLGVVELTIAVHRVFRSPYDTIIFDTGHQAYVHKLLTGRTDFTHLRHSDGLSGYPSRSESVHDVLENSHASAALSWAAGVSLVRRRNRERGYVVCIVGDGALTGGMSWEALNNIAEVAGRRLIVLVNDNGRSYAPTIGGLAHHLDALRTNKHYERVMAWGKKTLRSHGVPGEIAFDALHGLKKGVKDVIAPQILFEDLGIKYTGPVDGHDITAVEFALTRSREYGDSVIVHAITQKGRGYTPAEEDISDRFHAVGKIHPETGLPVEPSRFGWTAVFADEIVKIARSRPDIYALTAAMLEPVGLAPFAQEFPERVIDVGIAEQHCLATAAGMAFAGAHPVIALYATFLNRAYDQVLMDCALHQAGVTIVLDRAGITGQDGASHNGMWDMSLFSTVPGLRLAAARDEDTLRKLLRQAVDVSDAPTIVRYPKGSLPARIPAYRSLGGLDIIFEATTNPSSSTNVVRASTADIGDTNVPDRDIIGQRLVIVAVGAMATTGIAVGKELESEFALVQVVDPGWVIPNCDELITFCDGAFLVVTIEDGLVYGGVGAGLRQDLADHDNDVPVRCFGVKKEFLAHATREQILRAQGLESGQIADKIRAKVNRGL